MIKLLALDMDGTLLDDDNKIPESTVAAIKQSVESGIKVILASARPVCAMLPYYKQLSLNSLPIVSLCGAYILDIKNTKELFACSLSEGMCQKIYDLFERHYIKSYGKNTLYVNEIKAETLRYAENF
ncbi:HAD-superfamily hydrolase, subfamily IIB [Propionispira arboris]|uniref:HAD-superfamily hydrolase, subfamily IIB n=1 Tax=Propionispira arboris TaxID=84035 RepID=A0A1H6V3T3_9FIRM|nr:HAD-superfamily hydrolase, subfamily IIB [Propionispira arboris]